MSNPTAKINEELIFTRSTSVDLHGIYWVTGIAIRDSIRLHISHIQIKDKGDVSEVAATNGSAIFIYQTKTRLPSGLYRIDRRNKTKMVIVKAEEVDKKLWPEYEDIVDVDWGDCIWVDEDDGLISLSKGFVRAVREMKADRGIDFKLYQLAMAHGFSARAYLPYDKDQAIKVECENYRALIMPFVL